MRRTLINIWHSAVAKVSIMAVQTAATIVLARNLSPEDYGIVGFANVIMSLLLRLNSLGIAHAVIQRREADERVLGTALSLTILLSVLAFVVAMAAAPLAATMLDKPASVDVVRVLAFGILLTPLGFVARCVLTRDMRFGTLRAPSVAGAAARGLVSVGMALTGWNYWSLVAGNLAGTVTTNGLLHRALKLRIRLQLDWVIAKQLLAQGVPISMAGLVTFALLNADNFFIGTLAGPMALGFYAIALNWSTIGASALQEIVHSVLYPKFSRLQDDLGQMRQSFLRSLGAVACGCTLFNCALLVVADGFLVNILGGGAFQWLPAASALQVLCVYGAIRGTVETIANPIMALGDSKLLLYSNGVAAIGEILLLPLVVGPFGIEGVGVLVAVAYTSQCFFFVPYLKKRLNITGRDLARVLAPILFAGLTGVTLAFAVAGSDGLSWSSILLRLFVFAIAFLAVHEWLSRCALAQELRNAFASLRHKA